MRLALYQPEIPQNMGAAIRAAACFGAGLDIIEPCGFPLDSRKIARVAMDYGALAEPMAHSGWSGFHQQLGPARLILLTTKAENSIWDFSFEESDVILMGQESAGAPDEVHAAAFARLRIPLAPGARSLNITTAAAVALAEMRRQVGWGDSLAP
ncbi:MAG: tRNA (cytidine(34)-2'-O)-methyltransferase [Marinicaulis sp.]|nr:tRNA (cytidine(34)-2'-O)-methyltransferase [Marinicaulis sp.]